MARKLSMVLFAALAAVVLLQNPVSGATYFVGDSSNWAIPSSSNAYANWAANKNFVVGDILVFNFMPNQHDVAEVTKSAYDACNGTNPISIHTSSPTNITLSSAGEHYYICTFSGHCNGGQKLAINVSGGSPSPSPQPSGSSPSPSPAPAQAPRTSSPAPAPARGPVTYTVGGTLGWNILPGGASAYQTWASNKTFVVGDILVFNFVNASHDVAKLTKANYESCNTNSTISVQSNPPVRVTLDAAGEHFFTCTFPGHCNAGQKLAINVTRSGGSSPTPTPSAATPAPSSATPPPSPSPPSSAGPPSSTSAGSPPPSTTTESPPPPNAATSLTAAGFTATFLSFAALALWF